MSQETSNQGVVELFAQEYKYLLKYKISLKENWNKHELLKLLDALYEEILENYKAEQELLKEYITGGISQIEG